MMKILSQTQVYGVHSSPQVPSSCLAQLGARHYHFTCLAPIAFQNTFLISTLLLFRGTITYSNMFLFEDDIDIEDNTQKQKGPHFTGLSKQKFSKGLQALRGQKSILIRCLYLTLRFKISTLVQLFKCDMLFKCLKCRKTEAQNRRKGEYRK